ncbi:hypothetical protein J4E05_18845 [Thalassospira sp. NFXS8]|uniref:hypothetical protein n=1 Tax=Thalassospira sp. NFXS8 TaxID=2819093 RepID=UPI0032DF13BC
MRYPFVILLAVLWMGGTAHAQKENLTMKEKWFETRPVCFGRYVADVPKVLQPNMLNTTIDDFTITNLGPATQRDLEKNIAERQVLMEKGGPIEDSSFVRFRGVETDEDVTIILYDFFDEFDPKYIPPSDDSETYFLADGHLFEITGKIKKNERESRLTRLFRIAHATRPRDMAAVPKEAGYCIKDGFVALPPEFDFGTTFRLTNVDIDQNFGFSIDIWKAMSVQEATYRWPPQATKRSIVGLSGIEAYGLNDNGDPQTDGYRFEFYGFRSPEQEKRGLSIRTELSRRGPRPDQPPFSFEAGREFWNLVTNSMQVR